MNRTVLMLTTVLAVGIAVGMLGDQVLIAQQPPVTRTILTKRLSIPGLEQALTAAPEIGPPDYADEGLLQYLRTERVVPPYQTRGYKLVELVRIYEVGAERRS